MITAEGGLKTSSHLCRIDLGVLFVIGSGESLRLREDNHHSQPIILNRKAADSERNVLSLRLCA